MYKLTIPFLGFTEPNHIIRISDNAFIPFDPDNTFILRLESMAKS
jgi:hypothetical protein